MKSLRCTSICSSANSRQAWRNALASRFFASRPRTFSTGVLDRQPVAVPTGHVGRVESVERSRLDDDVLQDLVDRVPDVNRAVGIGRAVVQDEFRPARRRGPQPLVDLALVPPREHLGLAARQIAFHRKGGVGKIDGVLVVGHRGSGTHCDSLSEPEILNEFRDLIQKFPPLPFRALVLSSPHAGGRTPSGRGPLHLSRLRERSADRPGEGSCHAPSTARACAAST